MPDALCCWLVENGKVGRCTNEVVLIALEPVVIETLADTQIAIAPYGVSRLELRRRPRMYGVCIATP